jgi:tetratricopeptide (TPR) repeat protein
MLDKDHPDIAFPYNTIAWIYHYQKNSSEALKWYQKALAIREKVLGMNHPHTADTYEGIASTYGDMGDYSKAIEWYQKAYRSYLDIFGEDHPLTTHVKRIMEKVSKTVSGNSPLHP